MFTPAPFQDQIPTPLPQENQQQPEAKKEPVKKEVTSKDNVGSFVKSLTGLAAYIHELQIQSHLIHLNYEASNFLAVHKFLKKQYELHLKEFDDVSEYVRSMDYLLPMCRKGLLGSNKKFDHVKSYAPEEMLITYYKNLENLGMMSKKIQEAARKIKAIDIENYMAELCGNAFKSAWMIKATLRKG